VIIRQTDTHTESTGRHQRPYNIQVYMLHVARTRRQVYEAKASGSGPIFHIPLFIPFFSYWVYLLLSSTTLFVLYKLYVSSIRVSFVRSFPKTKTL